MTPQAPVRPTNGARQHARVVRLGFVLTPPRPAAPVLTPPLPAAARPVSAFLLTPPPDGRLRLGRGRGAGRVLSGLRTHSSIVCGSGGGSGGGGRAKVDHLISRMSAPTTDLATQPDQGQTSCSLGLRAGSASLWSLSGITPLAIVSTHPSGPNGMARS
jgi:hypothetical protein